MKPTTASQAKRKNRTNPQPVDPRTLPPLDLNQRYDALEASAYLRQCLATTRKQIADGSLKSFKRGSRRYIGGTVIAAQCRGEQ